MAAAVTSASRSHDAAGPSRPMTWTLGRSATAASGGDRGNSRLMTVAQRVSASPTTPARRRDTADVKLPALVVVADTTAGQPAAGVPIQGRVAGVTATSSQPAAAGGQRGRTTTAARENGKRHYNGVVGPLTLQRGQTSVMTYNLPAAAGRVAHPPPPPPPHAGGDPRGGAERYPERAPQSLPAPRQNGLVTSEAYGNHMTYYQNDAQGGHARPSNDRRQQSLPGRRPAEADKARQALSAPSRKNRSYSQPRYAPLPKVNNLMAAKSGGGGQGGETTPAKHVVTTSFAGISTRENEATHHKNNKFASNWAEVRIQNHIPLSTSPGPSPREEDRSHDAGDRRHGPSPDRSRSKGDHSPRKPTDAWSPGKENVGPDGSSSPRKDTQSSHYLKAKQPEKKTTIRFVMPDEDRAQDSRAETNVTQSTATTTNNTASTPTTTSSDPSAGHSPAPKKRRPQWNNRLNTTSPPLRVQQQQQKQQEQKGKSWRRYEAELTHAPEVTSNEQVYRAYTGQTKRQMLHAANDGDSRPSTCTSGTMPGSSSSLDEGEARERGEKPVDKEYILTRNEAKMYIHIRNVYGNHSYRAQRKEWIMKKLTEVQMRDLKEQMEEKRRRRQRKEESRRRQQEQLNHVRRKFKRGQVHRFRTQYVTSRVLEYEKGDRDLFGLPDEEGGRGPGYSDPAKKDSKSASPNRGSPAGGAAAGSRPAAQNKPTTTTGAETRTKDAPAAAQKADTTPRASGPARDSNQRLGGGQAGEDSRRQQQQQPNGRSGEEDSSSNRANPAAKTSNADAKSQSKPLPHSVSSDSPQKDSANSSQAQQKQPASGEVKGSEPQSKKGAAGDGVVSGGQSPKKNNNNNNNASVANGAKQQDDSKDKNPAANAKAVKWKEDVSDQSAANEAGKPADASSTDKTKTESQNTSKKPTPQTNKPETQKANQDQQQQQQQADKTPNKPSVSVGPKNNTAAKGENGATAEKSGIPAGKSELPAAEENKKADVTPNGVVQNGVHGKGGEEPRKKTTITKDSKGRYITTTKDFKVLESPRPPAGKPVTPRINGQREPGVKNGDNNPNNNTTTTKQAPASTQPASQGGKLHPGRRGADGHHGRRKSSHAQPKTEEEAKKLMEQKYGKMFDMNIGRSRKSSAGIKHPKMEGIDTVVVKVTDDKGEPVIEADGRKKMQKRQVKDVVKEAKDQLAVPDPDSSKRTDKGGKQAGVVRTASVDTLDFDDDDDDEDEEDVFERVRRKYNLQIDSDDDDVSK